MGYVALSGYLLIGAGPALVFFSTRVAHRAFLVVLTFTSCAIWILCALLLALPILYFLPLGSSWEYIAPLIVRWTTEALETIARHFGYKRVSSCDQMSMCLAWGLGQGAARSIFFFVSNAFLAQGPGTYYVSSCPSMPFFMTTVTCSTPSRTGRVVRTTPQFELSAFTRNLYPGGCMVVLPTLLILAAVLMSRASTSFLAKANR